MGIFSAGTMATETPLNCKRRTEKQTNK